MADSTTEDEGLRRLGIVVEVGEEGCCLVEEFGGADDKDVCGFFFWEEGRVGGGAVGKKVREEIYVCWVWNEAWTF